MLIRRALARPSDRAFWGAWLLAAGALAALGAWSTRRYALPFDPAPTRWVQDLDRYALAGRTFTVINDFGSYSFIAGMLIGFAVLLAVRGFRAEALVMAGAGAVHLVQLGLRQLIDRPFSLQQPPWVTHAGWGLRQFPGPEGFPSGHVFGEAIVYGLIILYAGRLIPIRPLAWAVRAACVAEILLGGPARMYTGAHWPSDVIGALLLAGLYVALAWRIDGAVRRIRALTAERRLAAEAGISAAAGRPRRIVRPHVRAPRPAPASPERALAPAAPDER